MKKRIMTLVSVMAMAISLTACGAPDITAETMKDAKVEKYVTLPANYGHLRVEVEAKPEVSESDVNAYIAELKKGNESFREFSGTVAEGDTVNIDYAGTIDGVAFDRGTAQDQYLGIGSHSFIAGFEDGLIGVTVGETVDLNLQFPENYGDANVAGKDCVFTVTVNYKLAEVTDANVSDLDPDYSDAAAYKQAVKEMMQSYVDSKYQTSVKTAIASKLLEECTFTDVPESLAKDFRADLVESITQTAETSGTTLEQYMASKYGVPASGVDQALDAMGEQCAKEGLALQAIANEQNLNISDETLESTIQAELTMAGFQTVDEYLEKTGTDRETMRVNLMYDAVYNYLAEGAATVTE